MRKSILAITFLFMTSNVFASSPDFRQINWGMKQQQVIKIEKAKLLDKNENTLVYDCLVDNKECKLVYSFQNNKLVCATYFFETVHKNLNDYIDDYKDLFTALEYKYKEPICDEMVWKDDNFKDSPSHYGLAVRMGHLIYASCWETETTYIILNLYSKDYKINLTTMYVEKNFFESYPESRMLDTIKDL